MAISKRRAVGIGVAGLLGLFLVAAVQGSADDDAAMAKSKEAMRPFEMAEQANPEVKGWRYSTRNDQMRGIQTRVAELQADDYNTYMTPTLTVWRKEGGGKGVQLDGPMVPQGIMPSCDYRTRTVAVKLDDGPVREMGCVMGMSVGIDSSLLALIKKSRRMTLETETNAGRQQFTFTTGGLTL